MAIHLPKLYLPIADLAEARGIEYAKLNKGLGLEAMSVADTHEDAATMAAEAVKELIERNQLHPRDIGRIYMGTESALDGAKPTATYVLDMLTQYFEPQYGPDCFLYCDVIDLTFACIGAVDAMQNTMDWVSAGEDRLGIVVGSDIAKYELKSTGEYTQGAGAIAMLIKQNPRLIAFEGQTGVATRPVHDFFKPTRRISKETIINEVLQLAGITSVTAEELLAKQNGHPEVKGVIDLTEAFVSLHKDTPVFDGPYSNDCYQQRIKEALEHYACQNNFEEGEAVTENWERLIFHLPYAFQARRMFSEIFIEETRRSGKLEQFLQASKLQVPQPKDFDDEAAYSKAQKGFLKAITKTESYRHYVKQTIEKGERASSLVGNLYASSIFLALMSTMEADLEENTALDNKQLGFFAYGSGSKSKVFRGIVQQGWKDVVKHFGLMKKLKNRVSIDYKTYENLHRKRQAQSVVKPGEKEFYLKNIHHEKDNLEGARTYDWGHEVKVEA